MSANEPTETIKESEIKLLPADVAATIEAKAKELIALFEEHGVPHIISFVAPEAAHEHPKGARLACCINVHTENVRLLRMAGGIGLALVAGTNAMGRAMEKYETVTRATAVLAGRN